MLRTMKSVCFSASALVCLVSSANAQATRTWVSGVGDDVNPCSRTAPCKTFAGAISKTAAGGEIDVLDPGGFGGVTITKSIRIDGTPVVAGVLVSGTPGITISAGVNDVVMLRGLTINGSNFASTSRGVVLNTAGSLIIENCDIYAFGQRGVSLTPTNDNVKVMISNSNISGNLSNGMVIQPTGLNLNVTLDNVHVEDNVNFGVSITSGSTVSIQNSVISGNGLSGIRADGTVTPTTVDIDGVLISGNATGIETITGSTTRVSHSNIVQNTTGMTFGGTLQSYGNNHVGGNTFGNSGMALIPAQ
jgi:Right handed beta helix region